MEEELLTFVSQDTLLVEHVPQDEGVHLVEEDGDVPLMVAAEHVAHESDELSLSLSWASRLTHTFLLVHPSHLSVDSYRLHMEPETRRRMLIESIDHVLITSTDAFVYPSINDWANVRYDPCRGLVSNEELKMSCSTNLRNERRTRYHVIQLVLLSIRDLLLQDSFATKRDLYYQHVNSLGSQSEIDAAINIVSVMLNVPRIQLRILATSKGLVAGHVRFTIGYDDPILLDAMTSPEGFLSIPHDVEGITSLDCSEARFVLIVEKDATFQKLLDDSFIENFGPCIIITGKGFPDVGSRQFVRLLADTSSVLPIFCLCDADPFGIEILCCYRYGSLGMALAPERLAVPHVLWLGVHPSDMDYLDDNVLLDLSQIDKSKLESLLARPYTQRCLELREELLVMRSEGKKAEIQSFVSISEFFKAKVFDQEWLL